MANLAAFMSQRILANTIPLSKRAVCRNISTTNNVADAMMRKAVLTEAGKPLQLETCPIPPTPAEGVRVRIDHCGVCHSDIHFQDGYMKLSDGGKVIDFTKTWRSGYKGAILGHEIAGVVEELGPNAETSLSLGDRVVVYPWKGCMACPCCHHGMNNLCQNLTLKGNENIGSSSPYGGGYATHIVLPWTRLLVPIPESVPSDLASLLPCSGITAFHALKKISQSMEVGFKLRKETRLLILGVGGLGMWGVKLASVMFKDLNAQIVAADISQEKLDLAQTHGADTIIQLDREADVKSNLKTILGASGGQFNGVVDFVGSPTTSTVGTMSLYYGASIALVGMFGGQYAIYIPILNSNSYSIHGSQTGYFHDLEELMELVAKHGLTYPSLEHYPLHDVNMALDHLRSGKVKGRAVLNIAHEKSSL